MSISCSQKLRTGCSISCVAPPAEGWCHSLSLLVVLSLLQPRMLCLERLNSCLIMNLSTKTIWISFWEMSLNKQHKLLSLFNHNSAFLLWYFHFSVFCYFTLLGVHLCWCVIVDRIFHCTSEMIILYWGFVLPQIPFWNCRQVWSLSGHFTLPAQFHFTLQHHWNKYCKENRSLCLLYW